MKLIPNVRSAWRFASVRLAAVAGVVAGWAAYDPAGFSGLVETLPPWSRPLVGLAVFATATGSRVITRTPKAGG